MPWRVAYHTRRQRRVVQSVPPTVVDNSLDAGGKGAGVVEYPRCSQGSLDVHERENNNGGVVGLLEISDTDGFEELVRWTLLELW